MFGRNRGGGGAAQERGCADSHLLRPNEIHLDLDFDAVPYPVVGVDVDSRMIVIWNEASSTLFGYSKAEASELGVDDLVPVKLRARFRSDFAGFRINGFSHYIDPARSAVIPILGSGDRRMTAAITVMSVSQTDADRKLLLATVRKLAEGFVIGTGGEDMLRPPAQGLVLVNCDGVVTSWSPALYRMLGYSPAEALSRGLEDLVGGDSQSDACSIMKSVESATSLNLASAKLVEKNGMLFECWIDVAPVTVRGTPVGAAILIRELEAPDPSMRSSGRYQAVRHIGK